jgi:trimeric autotransporter adhesin
LCSGGNITAAFGNVTASFHLSGELLDLQGSILTNTLVDNLQGLDKNIKTELNLIRKNCSNLGIDNLILGTRGGPNLNSSSSNNISLGADSLPHCEGGSQNIAIGQLSLSNVYNSYNCVAIGYQAGQDPASIGTSNENMEKLVAIGYQAKFLNSHEIVLGTASETTIIKRELQCSKDIHCQNLYIDYDQGVFLDYYILANLQGLTYNVQNTFNKFAKDCGNSITSGLNNAIFGNFGLPYLTSGSENVGIGHETGLSLINGSRNIFMGTYAGQYVNGDDNIAIGSQSGKSSDPAYSN